MSERLPPAPAAFVASEHAAAWQTDERISLRVDGKRVWGTVLLTLAGGRLLRIGLSDGRRVWRRA